MSVFVRAALALAALLATARAHPWFLERIPNGDAHGRDGSGIECRELGHNNCVMGAPRNAFGLDFKDAGFRWTTQLCEKDSDGDGVTNGEELGDPCCQWSEDAPTELRLDMLSHPGVAEEDGAKNAPRCERGTGDSSSASPSPESTPSPTAPSKTPTAAPTTTATATTPTATTTTPTPTPTPTPSPTPSQTAAAAGTATEGTPIASPPDDDDNVCFPAHALVELEDGSLRRMDELAIGDSVHVGKQQYSAVFMFTHQQQAVQYAFISLKTQHVQQSLMLTAGHFLYVNGRCAPASTVKVGDWLSLANGSRTQVHDVSVRIARGLYNPQTMHGDLVVDGVRVTTYTTSVEKMRAHSLLAPLRALYQLCASCAPLFEHAPERLRSAFL